jgi:copper chaperone CopZ
MEKHVFTIPNIACGHCVATIKNELAEIKDIVTVEGNPDEKQITVEWNAPLTLDKIQAILKDINYPATA